MPRATEINVTAEERSQLEAIARSRSLSHGLVRRARIVLGSADRVGTMELSRQHQVSRPTISLWRKRWAESGLAGLHSEMRPGCPRSIDDEQVAELIKTTLERTPETATQWSVRSLATETGLSSTSVHRYIRLFGLQPHRSKSFKLSNDPFFVEKVRDIVGLYLNPPEKTRWCSVSMRRASAKRRNERSRSCPWGSATSRVLRMTTCAEVVRFV